MNTPGPARFRELGLINGSITALGARVQKRKTLGVFATLGRARRLFRMWLLYSAMMMPFGYLSRQDTELIILRVAWLRGSAYESDQHRDLARRVGLSPQQIDAVHTPEHGFTGRRAVLLAATDELVRDKQLSPTTRLRLTAELSARDQVAFVMLVTNYDGLATALDVLGVPIDEPRRSRG
ncbi:carboxymuconolactone decarboxylase family protein [Corynebacterium sp. 320]|uniref:carboxymuconolactone decarboxylase family protein n=1 Tax=Corynebacterium TaxID=1716 RepID=UPI00125CBBDA|nr:MULTISPECIES: carboxymuconolactone decarboxylase family protein [Corynebacterium]KAB1503801.1 carboxymuconolactone decarboxylase family protein [Corynebacterium sp. 320]KAB1553099.1 carboxymuconolactone decarboxylase family protein [Corynebacterium sp. 321]KAB1553683.1 carboxymuconolactone decarboxylase family protein [Corynebacterium sp. 319]KAB3527937.1 carboxymuconolactone decarboxylase family protein [Corynebacterium sp. 250]KAB3540574.1 carboxymuconolactone decarboxylase family protein